jgi:putative ABC transport system ATP-binding protein
MLRLVNLSKSYREGEKQRLIFSGANLELAPGTFTALLGKSGSGKSTLLHLAAGLDQPDQGEIWCREQKLNGLDEASMARFRRQHIGFIFQFFHLFPTLTVAENVALIAELAGRPDLSPEPLLRRVGLWERRQSFPDRLSGGEQQRVAVARALVHRPQLVLADEPTGNLDQENGEAVLQLLIEVSREQGATLLVATHSQEVAQAADQVLRIRAGNLEVQ